VDSVLSFSAVNLLGYLSLKILELYNAYRKDIVFTKDDLTIHSTTAASLLNQATIKRDVVAKPLVKQVGFL